ncbi:MAG: hypothetical protein U1F36_01525 [Planctomycetota bacterium]
MASPLPGGSDADRPSRDTGTATRSGIERGLDSARRASSLPSGVFRTGSSKIERDLAGEVGEIFLRHMTRTVQAEGTGRRTVIDPEIERRNRVDARELDALLADLRARGKVSAPSIRADLASERAWILIDLSINGSDAAREIALRELGEAFADPAAMSSVCASVRAQIERVLRDGRGPR